VIALSIAALFVIGVAAIWGAPLKRWVERLAGDDAEAEESNPAQPQVPTTAGQRL
jgi:hypothetical protein